ncbi:hypothetical protein, partial [Streptomyces sp. BH105]
DLVPRPCGVATVAHGFDPAVRGVVSATAARGCSAELADDGRLRLGVGDEGLHLGTSGIGHPGDLDPQGAELLFQITDLIPGMPGAELLVQVCQQPVSAQAHGAQPRRQLPGGQVLFVVHPFMMR